tara:strand:- start:43406 stop:44479 length:1074 start_codon:yes stop_codon:yes gene_type:complete
MVQFKNHFDEWYTHQHPVVLAKGIDMNQPGVTQHLFNEALLRQHERPLTPASSCMVANQRAYHQHGRNAFVLSDQMCDMFEKTDLHNVKAEHVKLPYKAFYISLPVGRYKIWGGEDTEWHDAWGIYLRKGCSWEDPKFLVLSVAGGPNEKSISFGDDAMTWIGLDLEQIEQQQRTLEELVEDKYNAHDVLRPWRDPNNVMSTSDEDFAKFLDMNQTDLLLKATRIAINLILYLSHEGEHKPCEVQERRLKKRAWLLSDMDKMSPAKQLKASTKATLISNSTFHLIGDPHAKAEPAEVTKHWVRGHWHTYRVGKGRTGRVLKWVQPHQRGTKEKDSTESREYVFEEGDNQQQTKESRR